MSCNRVFAESIKSIISFMGSLYSASPYVPIDYAIPMARMEKTVENLHPTAIITDTDGKTKLESLNLDTEILIFDELADGQADDASVDKSLGVVCDLASCVYYVHIRLNRCAERRYKFQQRCYRLY